MRQFLALVFLMLVGCLPNGLFPQSRPVTAMENETVELLKDERVHCAGVLLGPHTILTAAHCVEDLGKPQAEVDLCELSDILCPEYSPVGEHLTVRMFDRVESDAVVQKFTPGKDLALLHMAKASVWYASLSLTDPEEGDELAVMGHPAGIGWVYEHGYVAKTDREIMDMPGLHYMQVQAPVYYGNSGGGTFNKDGRLVGIASRMSSKVPECAFFVGLKDLYFFVYGVQ